MGSNKQNELMSKLETDSLIESRLATVEEGGGGEGLRKRKEKEFRDTDNSVVFA